MNRRTLFITVIVALVVLASNWLSRQGERVVAPEAAAPRHEPDYFLERFNATSMDETGRREHELEAEMLVHYPDDDTMELTRPHMVVYSAEQPPWHIYARHGLVEEGGDRVHLRGDVRMEQPEAENGPIRLLTETLLVLPKKQYAETDDPLTLSDARSEVKAVGMRAHMADERVVLLSQVEGIHVPTP